ncbi:MAG: DoxX family protein [Acidimicrobiales bacterium]
MALAALLGGAGVTHFVAPEAYRQIVPRALGSPATWVRLSGLSELGCAALVVVPRTRRVGGWLAAGLFIAVFPANVKMALDGGIPGRGFPLGSPVVAWARLPLQVPLVAWAATVAMRAGQGAKASAMRTKMHARLSTKGPRPKC